MKGYTKIFVALDGTKAQRAVLERAHELAAADHAHLVAGHVVDSVPQEANGMDSKKLIEAVRTRIAGDLSEEFAAIDADENVPDFSFQVAAGPLRSTLNDVLIAPYAPDLVVCGERGLSDIKYAFVGSVSTHLIRSMVCDVLVVKQRAVKE